MGASSSDSPGRDSDMRIKFARFSVLFTLILWSLLVPLMSLRTLLQCPHLYRHWLRDTGIYAKLGQVITIQIMHSIPDAMWSPWIVRDPTILQHLLERAVDAPTFEALTPPTLVCWFQWWMGTRQEPCVILPELVAAIDSAEWEHIRAYLWETLPDCTSSVTTVCLPANPGDGAQQANQQVIWWTSYKEELVTALLDGEKTFIEALPAQPQREGFLWGGIGFTAGLTVATCFLVKPDRRFAFMAGWLFTAAASMLIPGVCLVAGCVDASRLFSVLRLSENELLRLLLPQIWPGLAYHLGTSLISTGSLAGVMACVLFTLIVKNRIVRTVFPIGLCGFVILGMVTIPETPIYALSPLPTRLAHPTPTPWPTATPTPLPTPTATPRPWPVAAGTALPPVVKGWWAAPEALRCSKIADPPVEDVTLFDDQLWLVYDGWIDRLRFSTFTPLTHDRLPQHDAILHLWPADDFTVITRGRDAWVYAMTGWTPIIHSRMSAIEAIRSVIWLKENRQVILGLENGMLWGIDRDTGGLVTISAIHESAVTVLAHAREPHLIYAGTEDGSLLLWDSRRHETLPAFNGHHAEIRGIIPAASGNYVFSHDQMGIFYVWDAQSHQALHRRAVADLPSTPLYWVENTTGSDSPSTRPDDGYLVGGTTFGRVFTLDKALQYQLVMQFDSPVSALYPVGMQYLIVGLTSGHVCVIGSP